MTYDPKRQYKGVRVKISPEGLRAMGDGVHTRAKASNVNKRGIITTGRTRGKCTNVLWDGYVAPSSYHLDFLEEE